MNNTRLDYFVDLDRYPIHELDSDAGQNLIARCHKMMAEDALCLLPDFLRAAAVSKLCAEITALEAKAHEINYPSTPYGWMDNAGFPPDHPRSQLLPRCCKIITTELLDPSGACVELFKLDELTEFVRWLLQYEELYRSECPTLAIQINIMDNDETFGWHFDTNDGVVSFTIQNAENGGGFEYAPLIRDEGQENYDEVSQVLIGQGQVKQPDMSPGTFSLFLGRRSLHKVSPVGNTQLNRYSLLFSYDRQPGMVFPQKTCERLKGHSSAPYLGAKTRSRSQS
ncbi:MAG: hypothetical protein ACI8P9_000625 [Parasphingorhabdus sp.]|jgi:hypothetical protein